MLFVVPAIITRQIILVIIAVMKQITKRYAFFLLIFILLLSQMVTAQPDKLGGWHIVNINYHLNKSFVLYGELQVRSQKLTDDFYYHELKGGVAYNFPQRNSLFVGVGDYVTYPFPGNFKRPAAVKEFRMWEQFVLNNNINRVKIEHRYRIEQRWLNGNYRNRFRYRLNPVVPINHKTVVPNTFFVTAFDEVFFTSKAPYFERNRFFAGAGYQFSKLFTFQAGFIRQFDYRTTDDGSGKNFIQTSFFFTEDHTQTKREHHPSTMD